MESVTKELWLYSPVLWVVGDCVNSGVVVRECSGWLETRVARGSNEESTP